ncbi:MULTISPECIES: diguanylate cyclase [unclassified Pseudoxanthomonas]|uniref:diguanylate cyclase n=1 Tax=unclassified Pseudoxanthomonas TaxID=2645906 RepID=UPI0008F24473|nr:MULTISPECIES: diguanylate cyclase [unclassified Pseudoxanthomonas]PPJ42558.1 diguanylate cyclase AdrA [Pseudoxanthomonas sp. KAs_5_3]SFV26890.1 diguanylate cyclase [Pseudoxanthomonas sp. YR558]
MPFDVSPSGAHPARHHAQRLPRRIYRLRMLGMGLAALPVGAVLLENGAGWGLWAWLGFTALLWPQVAYGLALRHREPFRGEIRNLLFDSMLAGMWVPLMAFNLLPSVLLVTLATVDKISTGIDRLWYWSLPLMLAGALLAGALTGFEMRPVTSMPVMLACLPMLLIHSIAVSQASYRLVRKVKRQNRLLDELSRRDTLSGLDSRGHWQEQASMLLAQCAETGEQATLMMIDIDHFKTINDRHGHAAGDDVLRAVAGVIRHSIRTLDCAGRLGGDEFAVLLRGSDLVAAENVAQRIREGVEALRLQSAPGLHPTVSLGLARADAPSAGLRVWLEAADRALYRAKSNGRNQWAIHEGLHTATVTP